MRRSARNYASVGRWLFRSRFSAVAPTLSANDGVAPTRSVVSPVSRFYPASPRCPSRLLKRFDDKTAFGWTGSMQRRGLHDAPEEHQEVDDDFMRKRPRPRNHTSDYSREMRRLMRDRAYSRVLELFEEMKARDVTIDVGIYMSVMKTYSRMNNVDMVKQVFDEVVAKGIKPDNYLFNTLIYAYASTGDVDAAFEAFHKMQEDYKIQPDPVTYRSLITVCGQGKDVDRARQTFNELVEKFGDEDVRNYNAMLEVYAENVDRARQTFNELAEKFGDEDVRNYNARLEVYAENVDSDTGEEYLQECKDLMALMKSRNVRPQSFTYVPLIKLSGKLGRSDEALGYLKESVGSDMTLTLSSFDFVFRSLLYLKLTDEELEAHITYCFNRMNELKLKATHVTFGGIIDLYEKKGDLTKALTFLKKLPLNNLEGAGRRGENFAAQIEIIQRLWENGTYSQDEALTQVSEVAKTMKSLRITLSYRGYMTWFAMCLKASNVEHALQCWKGFTEEFRWPSAKMTESMIRLALDHDRMDDAMQVLEDVKKAVKKDSAVTPTQGPYEAVLAHCAKTSETEHAKTVHEYMKEARVKPNDAIQEHLSALQLV